MGTIIVGSGGSSAVGGVTLINAGDPPTLINNSDPANDLYISDLSSTNSADLDNVVAIQPGQSVTFDGQISIYGYAAPGQTVLVQILPGATSISLSLLQAQLVEANLAKETGGNLATINFNGGGFGTLGYLGGTLTGALTSVAGQSIARDMLAGNSNVTTEIAAFLATGAANGSPGGIPLLRFTRQLGTSSSQTINPSTSVSLVTFVAVNQPSYECTFIASLPAGVGTSPFAEITIQWTDSLTGIINDIETFFITAGNGISQAITTYLSGPVRGDLISINVQNTDPAQTLTLTWVVNTTSHIFERDRLVQPSYQATAPIGETNPNGLPSSGLIAVVNPTVGGNGTATRLLATYNGKAGININARGQTDNFSYSLIDPNNLYAANGATFFSTDTPAGGSQVYANVNLPNGPVLYQVNNHGTTAGSPTFTITRDEY